MHRLLDMLAAGAPAGDEQLRDEMRRQIVVQLLAAQVVAHAAYTVVPIGSLRQARNLVTAVAGLQTDLTLPLNEEIANIAALRVCALLGIDQ